MRLAHNKMDRLPVLEENWRVGCVWVRVRVLMASVLSWGLTFVLTVYPGLKLEYFRAHDWEEKWIEATEHVTQEEYDLHHKTQSQLKPTEPTTTSQEMANTNDFSDYSMGSSDEFQDYLRQPVELQVNDPLK